MYPRLQTNLDLLEYNIKKIKEIFKTKPIFAVTKSVNSDDVIIGKFIENGITKFGESDISNIKRLRSNYKNKIEIMFLRTPMDSEIEDVAELCDYVLVSCETKIKKLIEMNGQIKIIAMVDMDDYREGISYRDENEIIKISKQIYGIGMNKGCLTGIPPVKRDIERLLEIKKRIGDIKVSLGGTYFSEHFAEIEESSENYILRIGEAFFTGINPLAEKKQIEGLKEGVFTLCCEVVEKYERNVKKGIFKGVAGNRKFAVVVCGNSFMNTQGLEPIDKKLKITGNTSEHMVIDITDSDTEIEIGSIVEIKPNYLNISTFFKNIMKNIEYLSTF